MKHLTFPCIIYYLRRKGESDQVPVLTLEQAIESLKESDPITEGYMGKKLNLPREQRAQAMIDRAVAQNASTFAVEKVAVESADDLEAVKAKTEALEGFHRWVGGQGERNDTEVPSC